MATKRKEFNETQRNLVVDLVQQGHSYRTVKNMTGIGVSTIQKIIRKYKTHGTTINLDGRGRKRKTSKRVDRVILNIVKKDRFVSARKILEMVKSNNNVNISVDTIRRRIHEDGFTSRVARKKPYLSKAHKRNRFEFAKKYVSMPLDYWKKVLWTDESKFNLKTSDGTQKVWRKQEESFAVSCIRATVKHGGGNVMVWGSMAWSGVGKIEFIDDKMNSEMYIGILNRNLKSSARKLRLGNNFIFQQDNDPKHRSKATTQFLENLDINILEWPSQSPDLNPIEHLWYLLDQKMGERFFYKERGLEGNHNSSVGRNRPSAY